MQAVMKNIDLEGSITLGLVKGGRGARTLCEREMDQAGSCNEWWCMALINLEGIDGLFSRICRREGGFGNLVVKIDGDGQGGSGQSKVVIAEYRTDTACSTTCTQLFFLFGTKGEAKFPDLEFHRFSPGIPYQ